MSSPSSASRNGSKLSPTAPVNPYGSTKLMVEHILRDMAQADPEWRMLCLRYFNPVGAHQSGLIGEDPRDTPNNLMPYVAQVAVGRLPRLRVFGNDYPTPDGTGVRDLLLRAKHLVFAAIVVCRRAPSRAGSIIDLLTFR